MEFVNFYIFFRLLPLSLRTGKSRLATLLKSDISDSDSDMLLLGTRQLRKAVQDHPPQLLWDEGPVLGMRIERTQQLGVHGAKSTLQGL